MKKTANTPQSQQTVGAVHTHTHTHTHTITFTNVQTVYSTIDISLIERAFKNSCNFNFAGIICDAQNLIRDG